MTSPVLVDPVMVAAAKLLECLDTQLTDATVPVCRTALVPGVVTPADECCACAAGEGQATVRVVQSYPTSAFPQPLQVPKPCAETGLAVVLEMTVLRCAHTTDDQGNPPTEAEVTSDAIEASRDAMLMRRAARCCFGVDELDDEDLNVLIGAWLPVEPDGGCHGGSLLVTARVNDCGC